MSLCFYFWRISQIIFAMISTVVTQELSPELGENTKSPPPFPMSLPISYQVLGADYLFLKEANQDIMQNSSMQTHTQPLVLLQAARPPAINASYGPLSVARAVPLDLVQTVRLFRSPRASAFSWKVQAFVLTRRVLSSAPKVRVLFYVAGREWDGGEAGADDELPCVTVFAFWQTQEVRGSCSLGGQRGTCLAELEPPAGWFSPAEETSSRERQGPEEGNAVELYYRARPSSRGGRSGEGGGRRGGARPPPSPDEDYATPMLRIGSVRLLQVARGNASISQLKLGDSIIIQTSSKPLKKTDIATFYVFMSSSSSLDKFTLKATVKKGMSFCTATPSNSLLWDTTLDTGADGTISIVCQKKTTTPRKRLEGNLREILQLDFEAKELSGHSESQVITWRLELPGKAKAGHEGTMRIYTTQRDFVGLAPLVTDTEILNTAVLTGKRVTVPVRTVAVEQDGSVTDVSEFTDCRSTNEDILKVSDRCDYVFVNGKEMRGKVKMAVNFTYSYLSAQLEMTVWIPRLPLQIEVSDSELSQIKGWRVPIVATNQRSARDSEDDDDEDRRGRGCTLQYQNAMVRVLTHFVAEPTDPRGQLTFMLGSDWQVDITDVVWDFLKVENPQIAQLQDSRVLVGLDVGMTTIQVMSPLSDSILAEKTVTVLDDKVTITELGVQLVSGLSLSLQLSPGSNRAIVATAITQEVLQSPKQEALISAWLQFSDGSMAPLDLYSPDYFVLTATSLDEEVVTVRQDPAWKWPVIVTEAEGQGLLVRVEMTVCEPCQKSKRRSVLAAGNGNIRVKFGQSDGSSRASDYGAEGEELENHASDRRQRPHLQDRTGLDNHYYGSSISDMEDGVMRRITTTTKTAIVRRPNGDKLSDDGGQIQSIPIDFSDFPAQVDLPRGRNMEDDLVQTPRGLTDLEIGMYALLGVFCLAILVFLINCISYALKYRHKELSLEGQETMNHAHDWVWLGNEAELLESHGSLSPQQDEHTTMMDSSVGFEEGSHLLNGGQKNVQGQVHRSADSSCPGKDHKGDSPTTKRKRVKFTTFTTIPPDNGCPSINPNILGHSEDIKWVCQDIELGDSKELRNYMERLNDNALKDVA